MRTRSTWLNIQQAAKDAPENPKVSPYPNSNQLKGPDEWVTGHEPMTGAQASYLKTLSEEAHAPDAFDPDLEKGRSVKAHRPAEERDRR